MVVVVILGLVLVVGTGVVISTIIDRLGTGLALSTAESTQREELGVSLPEVIDVKLPDGLSLLRVAPAGKDVLLELGNERTELIWIVNPKTGEIKSALRIN